MKIAISPQIRHGVLAITIASALMIISVTFFWSMVSKPIHLLTEIHAHQTSIASLEARKVQEKESSFLLIQQVRMPMGNFARQQAAPDIILASIQQIIPETKFQRVPQKTALSNTLHRHSFSMQLEGTAEEISRGFWVLEQAPVLIERMHIAQSMDTRRFILTVDLVSWSTANVDAVQEVSESSDA